MKGCTMQERLAKGKKLLSLMVAVLVCATLFCGSRTVAKAAEDDKVDVLVNETGTAEVGVEKTYPFTLTSQHKVLGVGVAVTTPVDAAVSVYDNTGKALEQVTLTPSDWTQMENGTYGVEGYYNKLSAGDYSVNVTFYADCDYAVIVQAEKVLPALNQKSATITVGYKVTLKVDNTTEKVTWSSSKKNVATVSSKGVVTGKSAGTTTITAKVDGQKLTCKVTVKANKFSETKYSVSDVYYGNANMQVYKATFDEKTGDLVLKCRFINNSGHTAKSLKGLKIVFKDPNGKKIGTYSAATKSLSVPHASTKDFTLTIKKDKLKKTKADLRNSTYEITGEYVYNRFY